MKSIKAVALIIAGFLPATTVLSANAATVTYDWTLSGPAASLGGLPSPGSGTITVTTGAAGDAITAITGTIGGDAITGLAATGTGLADSDNLLFPVGSTFTKNGTPYMSVSDLDPNGIVVITTAGNFDIWGAYAPYATDEKPGNNYSEDGPTGFGVGTFSLTPTPLPPTLALFAGGFGIIGLLSRRKNRKIASSFAA